MGDMADTVADMVVTTEARGLLMLMLTLLPLLKPMPMLTTDTVMAVDMVATDTAVDTDMAAMVVTTEARGPLTPKPLPPLKLMPMLTTDTVMALDMVATDMAVTDTAVDTDMAAMVATTEERG